MVAQTSTTDAAAEETTDEPVIVVRGIRQSLETAKEIKRNADTFVDSITASDVSTLPDLSVAEALGRVPGVTVSRFPTGGASPDFPSPEGRGNLIRGLGFVRSEFNGRDAFTANSGRALDWSSIPPELVGAVDVWKNQTADLIEGGIGGTINLRTLEPFDRKGRIIAIALDATYTDLRKKWSPEGSITLGDRWAAGSGELGLLVSYSRSKLDSRIHGWQQNSPTPRVLAANGTIPFANQYTGGARLNEFTGVPSSQIIGTTPGFQMRTNDVDRDRESYYGALQWKNDTVKITAKYVRSKTDIDSIERTFEWWPDHDPGVQMQITDLKTRPFTSAGVALCNGAGGFPSNPGDCETLIPVSGGLMTSGHVTANGDAWTGAQGAAVGSLGIGKTETSLTQDWSANVQWKATDRLNVNLDGHYTKASARFRQLWGGLNTWLEWDITPGLDHPRLNFSVNPTTQFNPGNTRFTGDSATNLIPRATSSFDPNGSTWQYAADQFQVGSGDEYAFRADLNYDLSGDDGLASWFTNVQFGARYAERSQKNQEMALNWGAISPAWGGFGGYGVVGTFQNPGQAVQAVDFSDFFRGGVVQGSNNKFLFVNDNLLTNYSAFRQYLLNEPQIAGQFGNWNPRSTDDGTAFGKPNFRPEDTSNITEATTNAYIRLDFGQDFENDSAVKGNFGLRYVRTNLDSTGFRAFRAIPADNQSPAIVNGVRVRTDDAESRDDICDAIFVPAACTYASQAAQPISYKQTDERWLPSFNVKWNVNRDMLFRFGVSKAISRPNVQDLRASQEYSIVQNRLNYAPITDVNDPLYGIDRGAANITVDEVRVSRGNPQLRPTTAWNYDLSWEWYFKGGFVSLSGFYKDLKDIISNGQLALGTTTIGGKTVNVTYDGQVNQAKAKIKGVEVAYQQFFDFLPGPLKHLGVQANYTFIDATAQPPLNGADADGNGVPDDQTVVFRFGVKDMLGQSKHMANLVGIYQDDRLEARLAYNWRSKYLTTYRDYVTGNPVYNSASGFLDASLKYKVTDFLQVRSSIANILDTKSKARVQIDQSGQLYDRFSFLNDRRIVVGALLTF